MRPEPPPKAKPIEKEKDCILFSNSPIEDVNHAKSFWKSLTLQPPLESRLVSADIRQRLRIATPPNKPPKKTRRSTTTWEETKTAVFLHNAYQQDKKEVKQKYRQLMLQREAALNLLHKQRLERLQKELISLPYKPAQKTFDNKIEEDYISDELE
ncbi:cilia- and flagella-associated protein HOATZ-like [Styela clava]|uniref:cilia- and flagella-associated protein HOATZ-like n=1 Tax=Styela clava TaxID=7725 RepID=UPI00193A1827|nr:cilia- and flagella-associated protein HOATZ-like [Styela clava]